MIQNGREPKHQFLEQPLVLPYVWPLQLSKEWHRMEVSVIQRRHAIRQRRPSFWVHGLLLPMRKLVGLLPIVSKFTKYTIQRYTRSMLIYSKESRIQDSKHLLWLLIPSYSVKDWMIPGISSPFHIHIKWKILQNTWIKGQNLTSKEKKGQVWLNSLRLIKIMRLVGMLFHLWKSNQDFLYMQKVSCVLKTLD